MLKTSVGYSNIADAYEAGVETAKKATEGLNPKVGLLFNSVGYEQKELIKGVKSVMPDVDVVGCTSSAGIITPEGYMIDESGTAGMLTLDDEDLTVSALSVPNNVNIVKIYYELLTETQPITFSTWEIPLTHLTTNNMGVIELPTDMGNLEVNGNIPGKILIKLIAFKKII